MKRYFVAAICMITICGIYAQRPPALVSPEINDDNSVIFRIDAPGQPGIRITGSWMEDFGATSEMVKNDEGIFEITVGPLPSEMYTYSFLIDGIRVIDPSNPSVARDGRRNESMFIIPGGKGDLYMNHEVPHGRLEKVWYPSPALGMDRRMYVYTPPCYHESDNSYPVLYLLHGGGGDEDAWSTLGRTPQIMDNLIARGSALPMIVVMPNGNPTHAAAPTEQAYPAPDLRDAGRMGSGYFEKSLMSDIIPFISKHYRVKTGKENRAVSGLSMGGIQTMNISYNWPEEFSYYGVMSMGLVDMSRFGGEESPGSRVANIDRLRRTGPKLYWVACGTDDFLYQSVLDLVDFLEEQEFPHIYFETAGGHTWDRWRFYLSELAPLLFR